MPQQSNTPDTYDKIMTLTGKSRISILPDIAVLRLGVQTTGDNLTEVQQENARISQSVLQSLQQLGIEDIKTFQYTIRQLTEYEDGQRIDRGYSVRNILEIRTIQMELIGEIIDTAVNNGANVVELIDFDVSDPEPYYLQALNLAVWNAYEKAKSIADNLGSRNLPIPKKIAENSTSLIPFRTLAAGEGSFATPIESGNIQIEASVTVDFIW